MRDARDWKFLNKILGDVEPPRHQSFAHNLNSLEEHAEVEPEDKFVGLVAIEETKQEVEGG
jgi:hypothetical protein